MFRSLLSRYGGILIVMYGLYFLNVYYDVLLFHIFFGTIMSSIEKRAPLRDTRYQLSF